MLFFGVVNCFTFPTRPGARRALSRVLVESGVSDKTIEALKAMGHRVQRAVGSFGGYQGILIDQKTGVYHAASDNRKDGCAAGY